MNAPNLTNGMRQAGAKIACRAIEQSDLPSVIALLCEGFPERAQEYWEGGFERLRHRSVPDGYPRYGYVLAVGSDVVGCLLLVVSRDEIGGVLRANVSSWYVVPKFRSLASMLVSVAFKQRELTFINISPAPHTIPILEAQGYRRYAAGQFIAVLAIARGGFRATARRITADGGAAGQLAPVEFALLQDHARYGCLSLVITDGEGDEPFVFVKRRLVRGLVPSAQLLWCRDIARIPPLAGALGRSLLRHGIFAVSVDANGPITGLAGMYREGSGAKYFRGPHRPRLGDLAETEIAIFGV